MHGHHHAAAGRRAGRRAAPEGLRVCSVALHPSRPLADRCCGCSGAAQGLQDAFSLSCFGVTCTCRRRQAARRRATRRSERQPSRTSSTGKPHSLQGSSWDEAELDGLTVQRKRSESFRAPAARTWQSTKGWRRRLVAAAPALLVDARRPWRCCPVLPQLRKVGWSGFQASWLAGELKSPSGRAAAHPRSLLPPVAPDQ